MDKQNYQNFSERTEPHGVRLVACCGFCANNEQFEDLLRPSWVLLPPFDFIMTHCTSPQPLIAPVLQCSPVGTIRWLFTAGSKNDSWNAIFIWAFKLWWVQQFVWCDVIWEDGRHVNLLLLLLGLKKHSNLWQSTDKTQAYFDHISS